MARFIDAELLDDEYYELYHHGTLAVVKSVLHIFKKILDNQPTADVVEVKHGKWSRLEGEFVCLNCYNIASASSAYCPLCGTKMDGGKEE